MKETIRAETFETNSSAVHSVVLRENLLDKFDIPLVKGDSIVVELDEDYQCTGTLTSQYDKLQYLLSYLFVKRGWDNQVAIECGEFKSKNIVNVSELCEGYLVADAVSAELGRQVEIYITFGEYGPEFNHQVNPAFSDNPMDSVMNSEEEIRDFIFGPCNLVMEWD